MKPKDEDDDYEKIPINRENYIESLSNRYKNKADALQNEGIQNPVDEWNSPEINRKEKLDTDKARIKTRFDPEKKELEVRDNVGGMKPTVLKDRFMTFEDGEKDKDSKTRGSEGQGGAIFLAIGDKTEIETLHYETGERTTAEWTSDGYRKFDTGLNELDQPGTIFRVKNVHDDFVEQFKNFNEMEKLVRRYWQKTLQEDDVIISYQVRGYVEKRFEPYNLAEDNDEIEEIVTREDIDGVEKLEIIVFKEGHTRPDAFNKMLAMNVYGQTIEWKNLQDVHARDRVLAFAEVPELRGKDFPNHRGFRPVSEVREIKNQLKGAIQEKMDEYRDVTETSQEQDNLMNEAIDTVSELIEGTEFEEVVKGDEGGEGPVEPEEKDNIYPKSISIKDRDVEHGDTFKTSVMVENPKGQGYDCDVELEFLCPRDKIDEFEDQVIASTTLKEDMKVKANAKRLAGTHEFKIPDNDIDGRYRVRANVKTLYRKNPKIEGKTISIKVGEIDPKTTDIVQNGNDHGIEGTVLETSDRDEKSEISDGQLWLNASHPSFQKQVVGADDEDAWRDYVTINALRCLSDMLMREKVEKASDPDEVQDELAEVRKLSDKLEGKYSGDAVEI